MQLKNSSAAAVAAAAATARRKKTLFFKLQNRLQNFNPPVVWVHQKKKELKAHT